MHECSRSKERDTGNYMRTLKAWEKQNTAKIILRGWWSLIPYPHPWVCCCAHRQQSSLRGNQSMAHLCATQVLCKNKNHLFQNSQRGGGLDIPSKTPLDLLQIKIKLWCKPPCSPQGIWSCQSQSAEEQILALLLASFASSRLAVSWASTHYGRLCLNWAAKQVGKQKQNALQGLAETAGSAGKHPLATSGHWEHGDWTESLVCSADTPITHWVIRGKLGFTNILHIPGQPGKALHIHTFLGVSLGWHRLWKNLFRAMKITWSNENQFLLFILHMLPQVSQGTQSYLCMLMLFFLSFSQGQIGFFPSLEHSTKMEWDGNHTVPHEHIPLAPACSEIGHASDQAYREKQWDTGWWLFKQETNQRHQQHPLCTRNVVVKSGRVSVHTKGNWLAWKGQHLSI